jgi:hypothetical protein
VVSRELEYIRKPGEISVYFNRNWNCVCPSVVKVYSLSRRYFYSRLDNTHTRLTDNCRICQIYYKYNIIILSTQNNGSVVGAVTSSNNCIFRLKMANKGRNM